MKILTKSGIMFDYNKPTKDMIHLTDVLTSLARINRYLGHTERPYSVAEHTFFCLVMAQKLNYSAREQLLVLVHDFTEAYVGDCPAPLKALLPNYCEIEAKVDKVIYEYLGVKPPTEEEFLKIKYVDMTMLVIEMKQLTKHDWELLSGKGIHEEFIDDDDFDLSEVFSNEDVLIDLLRELFCSVYVEALMEKDQQERQDALHV